MYMILVTPDQSGFWDQSQANSALYSVFWSVEQTDLKSVIVENIHWALFKDAEVAEVKQPRNSKRRRLPYSENFHFSNLLAASEAGGWIIWKMKVFRIRQSIAHFDQWKPLISKVLFKLKSNGRPPRLLRFRGRFWGHWGQNFKII